MSPNLQEEHQDVVELSQVETANVRGTSIGENDASANNAMDRATLFKLICAGYGFFVAGVNDGSLGPLIPYLTRSYGIKPAVISILYASNFLGWFFAAVSNTHLCQYLDLGVMLLIGSIFQIIAQVIRIWMPPFPLFAVTFWMICVGQAYQDTHANTFVSSVRSAHRWLGFIHSMYMAGCLVGPFASAPIASVHSSQWSLFYAVPLGLGVINLGLVITAFRDRITILRPSISKNTNESLRNERAFKLIKETFRTENVWILSLFFFFYLGASITASGWIVEYLVTVRKGDVSYMGYIPAGFSGGCLLGRLLLVEPTHHWGERRMVFIYSLLCIGLQLLFWLVPNIIAASIAMSLLGFFSGPFFASGISIGSKLFPPGLRPTALAFVFVNAQIGGSVFPIMTSIIVSHAGVALLQPVLVGLFSATAISWLLVPKSKPLHKSRPEQE